jgi:N-acetylmuramoyl-L-alanine amidase
MCHRKRLLHILASAPVTIATMATFAWTAHAQNNQTPPQPIVVAIDPGHGGAPDNNHPDQLFDPGVIGVNGVLEKDVTLDISRRLRTLLKADMVKVVMTRDSDQYVSIQDRTQKAQDNHADLFISIHSNSFNDPATGGALILYPNDKSSAFANTMSATVAKGEAPYNVANDGVQLRNDLWMHTTMPTVTLEAAFLTNAHEADLLGQANFREIVADSARDGIEQTESQIAQRKTEIVAWNQSHPNQQIATYETGSTTSAATPTSGNIATRVLPWIAILAVAWFFRRALLRFTIAMATHSAFHRLAARRRRRAVRQRSIQARARQRARPQSLYDELWL